MSIPLPLPLPVVIADTCATYYGTRAKRYNDNRCGACPLRVPCLARGSALAPSIEQLETARRTFIAESLAILGGVA